MRWTSLTQLLTSGRLQVCAAVADDDKLALAVRVVMQAEVVLGVAGVALDVRSDGDGLAMIGALALLHVLGALVGHRTLGER